MCLLEKIAGELARRAPGALHIGKGIEGAARHPARNALQRVEPIDDDLAPRLEALAEALDLVHRPGDGGKPRHLGGDIDAGMIDGDELPHMVDEPFRPDAEAQPPAGHGKGLGPAVEDYGAVAQFGESEKAREFGSFEYQMT